VGVDTQGRNQQVAANYTALPVDSGNGNTFIAGIADSIANVVTLTGNATINVGYSVGGSGSARVGGVVTGANTLNLTGVPANSAISSSATTVSTGANFNVDGNVTFNPGALNDNGVAVAMTKSGPGLMRIGTTATSVVAGTSLNVTAGAVAFGGTGDSLTGSVPFGSGSVTLQSGATLRLDGQTDGPGLLGQYYSVTPANVANSNPNFATLTTLNAHLATLTPTVTASTTLNGKLDFDFSNINYGDGAPFNGGDPTRGDYGFTNTDNMEVRWTGYINITNPGLATFSTTSDDGTVIFINDGDTPVVNNNFYQGATTRTGTYNFTTPGYHKITMGFYEGTGGSGALFQWNQAGDSLHTLLNSEVVKPFGAQQTYTNNVNIAANSTIAVSNSLKAGVGAVSIGTATLSVTSPDPTTSAYSLTASGTTLTGNPTFNVADSTGGGKGTFNTGALNDGGVARTITKTNTGTLRVDSAGTSLVAGTIFDVQQGTLSTASSLVNPLGNSAVQLSGGRLSLDGTPGIATGLLTQLYDTTPASQAVYNNLNTLNAYLDGLTPVVMTGSTTGGKLDFNYSNDNYGGGAPFNGPNDATHAAYGFAPANNMQVRWTGFINVGTIGLANFWSTSDDGSMIFVNGQVVVNNNGSHGAIEQTGTFDFTTTGWHEITLAFFEGDGGAGALFEWNEFGGTRHTMLSSETQHQGFAQIQSYANNVLVTQDSEISVSNSLTAAIGTLSVGGQTLTVSNPNGLAYTLTAASTTLTGSPTLHVTSGSFAPGAITGGANAITKTGSGTLLLDKTNTYSGTTTISEGVLQVGDGGTDGTLGSGEIINDAVLTFNRSDTVTVTNDITGSGTVNNNGTATNILNLDGVQGYLTLNANGGTTNVNESFTGGTATVNVNANAALNFTANQTLAALNIGDGATVVLDSAAPAFGSVEPSSQAAIPEPGSAGLLLVGVLGLFARRRRD
jgi:autotransporter-associated beta strand protein